MAHAHDLTEETPELEQCSTCTRIRTARRREQNAARILMLNAASGVLIAVVGFFLSHTLFRLEGTLDKLNQQFTELHGRVSHLEGATGSRGAVP